MKDTTVIKTGIVGSALIALCCFTPVLLVPLAMLGLSAWLGWLDYVLFPALLVFVGIAGYGVWRRVQGPACGDTAAHPGTEGRV